MKLLDRILEKAVEALLLRLWRFVRNFSKGIDNARRRRR